MFPFHVNVGNIYATENTKAAKIQAFGRGTAGQEITIMVKDTYTTFAHGGGKKEDDLFLYLGVDYTAKNGDVVVFESLPDPEKDSAFDIRNTVVGIIDPDA